MNAEKKTPVVALHNFMTKQHGEPIYELLAKFGKSHKPWFRYRCTAMAEEVIGTGHSKRDAKNIVANMMLKQLSLRGYMVPPEFACPDVMHALMDHAGLPTHSFVVLVNELSKQYHLDPVEYEVLADPAGQSNFTVKARIGHVERVASASSKRMAYQLAAEQIYRHLRTRLSGTRHFNEDEVMYRAYERAMALSSDEETPDEQQRREEEEEAAAARKQSKKNKKQKNRQSQAVQETVRLEMEHSNTEPFAFDVASVRPPTPHVAQQVDDHVAINFIVRTMDRLGI